MNTRTLFVGIDGKQAVDSKTTQAQIDEVKKLICALVTPLDKPMSWDELDHLKEPRTVFQSILIDRSIRIDEKTPMANEPNFAVITADESRVVRLEYYEDHNGLELVFDFRAPAFKGKTLPTFLEENPRFLE